MVRFVIHGLTLTLVSGGKAKVLMVNSAHVHHQVRPHLQSLFVPIGAFVKGETERTGFFGPASE